MRRRHAVPAELAATTTIGAAVLGWLAGRAVGAAERRRLDHDRMHDPLTGLLNRAGWQEQAHRVVTAARRDGRPAAVGIVDLDWLKQLNDSHGHAVGDAALRALGCRLAEKIPPGGLAARLGGDEFAVVLVGDRAAPDHWPTTTAEALCRHLCRPVVLAGLTHHLTVCIGVAAADTETVDTSMLHADWALYQAKDARAGGGGFVTVYAPPPRGSPRPNTPTSDGANPPAAMVQTSTPTRWRIAAASKTADE